MMQLTLIWQLPAPLIEQLGWIILHSAWQTTCIAFVAGLSLAIVPKERASLRYVLLVLALMLAVTAPVLTVIVQGIPLNGSIAESRLAAVEADAVQLHSAVGEAVRSAPSPQDARSSARNNPKRNWTLQRSELLQPWVRWITGLWMVGVAICSLRPLLGCHAIWRLKRFGLDMVSPDVQELLARVSRQLRVRSTVRIAVSTLARAPIVIGYVRPIILMPVSLLTSLPPAQLEAILAHELAHVRRHDFLVNLMQVIVETLFFYHPAAWWLSRQIRIQREHCCDDLVVAAIGDPVDYSRALLAIADQFQHPALVLGASDGSLAERVRRILGVETAARSISAWLLILPLVGLLGTAVGSGLFAWQGPTEPPAAFSQEQVLAALPDWLRPFHNNGLLATVDRQSNVIGLTGGEVLADQLLTRLKDLPKLRELDLSSPRITAEGLAHLADLSALEKLTLSLHEPDPPLGDTALKSISKLTSLRELNVNSCGTTDAGVRHLESLTNLTHLSMNQEGRLTDAAIDSIATLSRLKSLSLSSYVATERFGMMHFSKQATRKLSALTELEELYLVNQGIAADSIQFPRLKSLSVGGSDVDDACAKRIAQCRELQSLELVYTKITDAGLKDIATLPNLQRLNLDSHLISDNGIALLPALTTLEHLSLRDSAITDQSLKHIAKIKSLTRFDLSGTGHPGVLAPSPADTARLTAEGLRVLQQLPRLQTLWLTNFFSTGGYTAIGDLKQLRSLTLMMTGVSREEVRQLKQSLPAARIDVVTGGGDFSSEDR